MRWACDWWTFSKRQIAMEKSVINILSSILAVVQ